MRPSPPNWEFDRRPHLVFWETTRACRLACRHCRAEALEERDPEELNLEEAESLLRDVRAFGPPAPILVLTGGDLLMRPDALDLVRMAADLGLRVAAAPSVTPLLDGQRLGQLVDAGVKAISLSLDGAQAATHDGIRGVEGTFEATLGRLREAMDLDVLVQVNTAVMRSNVQELPEIVHLLRDLGVPTWEVFFLIKTGRGAAMEDLEPWEYEEVAHFLHEAASYGLAVRTTEAPHFRRVVVQRREGSEDLPVVEGHLLDDLVGRLRDLEGEPDGEDSVRLLPTGDGKGIVFVNHRGLVYPSGFLPLPAGSVRGKNLTRIYRESPLFRNLRRPDGLGGRCGGCRFQDLCGGSRSRAFATYGDPLAEDPACVYQPT